MTHHTHPDSDDGVVSRHAGVQIDASTDPASVVQQYLGSREERLRTGERRRKNIRTYLFVKAGRSVRVHLGDYKTASVKQGDGTPVVRIPTREHEQLATDYDRETFDQIVQYGYADHERGHIVHTPGEYVVEQLKQFPKVHRNPAHRIYNALEDGAIEGFVRDADTSAGLRLSTLHANLSAKSLRDFSRTGATRTFLQAVQGYILDIGRYDAGFTRMLIDHDDSRLSFEMPNDESLFHSFRPEIEDTVADVVSEADHEARIDRIMVFAELAIDRSPRAPDDMLGEEPPRGMGGDGGGDGDDPDGGDSGPTNDTETPDTDTTDEDVRERVQDVLSGGSDDAPEDGDDAGDDLEEQRRSEQREADSTERAMKAAARSLTGSGDGNLATGEVTLAEPVDDFEYDRWQDIKDGSKNLLAQFEKGLEDQSRDGWERGLEDGDLDPSRLVDLKLGAPDCMRRRVRTDPPDYSVVLLVDRSGSMNRADIECAERASTSLALSLERKGIDVCVMDMLSSVARVANPFELPVRQSRRMMVTGITGGGTPLSDALSVAADRVRWKSGETFVVVITDGDPDDEEAYSDTLNDIGAFAHVVGVEIALGNPRDRPLFGDNYHLGTSISDPSSVTDDVDRMMARQAF